MWAMAAAVETLSCRPRLAIVDGNRAPRLKCETRTIVKGDAKCLSIAAASIVAKVTRDRMMIALARDIPGYGFERHKGYGTPEHRAALVKLGISPHHRRSWKSVQLALGLLEAEAT
jgi:ribonuclease HII